MRVIIAGSRHMKDYDFLERNVEATLQEWHKEGLIKDRSDITIVSGTCRGADRMGERYAIKKGYLIQQFPPNWERYGHYAGPHRNRQMAENSDACIVFLTKDSKGSKNMAETAVAMKLVLKIIPIEV